MRTGGAPETRRPAHRLGRISSSGPFALLALISVHVAAAIFTEFREGGTVISAMFTGTKWHADEPVDRGLAGGARDDGARGPGDNAKALAPTREVIEG